MTHPLAQPLFDALATYDVDRLRSLLAPDFRRWLNASGVETTRDEFLQLAALEHAMIEDPSLELRREIATEDGFVLLLDLAGRVAAGEQFQAGVCLIVTVSDELVRRIDEYIDSRPLSPLIKAITTAASPAGRG
jgi:ketosteroid isomerase-like protein